MKIVPDLKTTVEYLGGSEEETSLLSIAGPTSRTRLWLAWLVSAARSPWVRGLWWAFLALLILLFSGQTSKFIYIDF